MAKRVVIKRAQFDPPSKKGRRWAWSHYVVDHEKQVAVGQELLKTGNRSIDGFKGLTLAGEHMNQVADAASQFSRVFAKRDPKHAIEKGLLNSVVMADRSSKCGPCHSRQHREGLR